MNAPGDSHDGAQARAAQDLLRIQADIEIARSALSGLHRELGAARAQLDNKKASRLLEANEQLVLATLAAQRAAEESARAVKELTEAAELDPLTRLPTPALLRARLALAVGTTSSAGPKVAVLLINLADFKLINDTLGRAIGDQVLQVAGHSLVDAAGPHATVGRHGKDEFLVLLPGLADSADAVAQATSIIAALGAPALIQDHVLRLAANVGISIYPQDGADPDSLIDRAVAAMYRAKWRGLGSYAFQDESGTAERSVELRTLESMRQPLIDRRLATAASESQQVLLQQANTQLLMAAISAQELQAAAEEAQRRQTLFLGMLAHELRNPLAPISNAAALLGHIKSEAPVLSKVQEIIERQVRNMTRLVEDLLDVSRVNAGKLRLQKERVDIASLMDDVVDACRPKMDTRLQAFEIHLPAAALEVHADPVRLTQILTNLLDNASKYTPFQGHIRFAAAADGNDVLLTVADNGIGISEEALGTIFEPFSQEPHATLFNGAGLGIGLTVVRELVEGHGGRVTAVSEGKGHGSQFLVRLPLADHGADGVRPESNPTSPS
jgi:diguanylate cyclase